MADFERARARLIAAAHGMPADLGTMYEALVSDPAWDEAIAERLAAQVPLAAAIADTASQLAAQLADVADPYLRARGHDFEQIGAHLVRLLGTPASPPGGAILCAHDVSAVELMQWAPQLAGVVLIDVAPSAHLTIVTRGVGLPAIALSGAAGRDAPASVADGAAIAVLDGFAGWLETAADPDFVRAHPARRAEVRPDPLPVIAAGRTVGVFANLNAPEDAPLAAALGADGVGLLRTEFQYVGRAEPPSLDVERGAYASIASAFAGRPIVVRALDLGGDKVGGGLTSDELDHGMLGIRGLRLLLRHPDAFARHLRAIVEGFRSADLRIMFPMVTFADEFARAREFTIEAARMAGIGRVPPLGVMIEVPAAAYACAEFAQAGASFVSFGTNDLAQYFFAAHRLASDAGIDPTNSAAFRTFLRGAIGRAQAAGLEVGVCGEAAAAPELSAFWLDCGVDELSVAPGLVPWLKARLRDTAAAPLERSNGEEAYRSY